jgi:hypothetical protein
LGRNKTLSEQRYIYEIDDALAIRVWDTTNPNEENKPFLYQPNHPDGTAWADKDAATAWIDAFIVELLVPPVIEEEPVVEETPTE